MGQTNILFYFYFFNCFFFKSIFGFNFFGRVKRILIYFNCLLKKIEGIFGFNYFWVGGGTM